MANMPTQNVCFESNYEEMNKFKLKDTLQTSVPDLPKLISIMKGQRGTVVRLKEPKKNGNQL